MIDPEIQNLIDQSRKHPAMRELASRFFPKRYRMPHWTYPLDYIQIGILSHLKNLEMRVTGYSEENSGIFTAAAFTFRGCGSPLYVVEPDCPQALMRTECPDDIKLGDLEWPFDGFMLALPRETMKAGDEYITHIIVSKSAGVGGAPMLKLAASTDSTSTYNFSEYFDKFNLAEACNKQIRIDGSGRGEEFFENDTANIELKSVISVSLSCLMLMNAAPDEIYYVPDPTKVKGKKKDPRDWINPRFLGKTYMQPKRVAVSGKSGSREFEGKVDPHWRRGHWRNQPFGPRDKIQYRLTWIRPMKVGYDEKETES